jgi:Domain of unknown function (DUF4188)
MTVIPGRMRATIEGDFVVFLIGMRINRPWKLHKWVPVARAMGPMLRALRQDEALGLLGFSAWVGPTGPLFVQYWRSVEHLEAFARDPKLTHHPAWRAYSRNVGGNGDVGVWHETYQVRDGAFEAMYGNMPRFGLATAGEHAPMAAASDAAGRAGNAAVRPPAAVSG